jgi:predicted AAA+ superfamily ATPase
MSIKECELWDDVFDETLDDILAPEIFEVVSKKIHGKSAEYSARPARPLKYQAYSVKTLWGYFAHSLGRYDAIREDDDSLTAPAVESIFTD